MKPKLVNIYKFRLCPTLCAAGNRTRAFWHSARRRYSLDLTEQPNYEVTKI